jgi:antitoxin component YwqK of YwqJK toxin-antitoxin module
MNFKSFTFAILLGMGCTNVTFAQNNSVIPSIEFIQEGIKLYDNGKYQSAYNEFKKVHRNDTNYALALYETALTQNARKKYEDAIALCEEGLLLNSDLEFSFFTMLGTSYSNNGQYDSAVRIYDRGLKNYPKNASLHYNKAVALMRAKKYQEAILVLQENAKMNPYHALTHFQLANICQDQNLYSQSVLAYLMYFMMADDSKASFNQLAAVDQYLNGSMKSANEFGTLNFLKDGFEDLDELVLGKIAINNKYKTPSKFTFPIIKQAHFIISQFSTISDSKGFWSTYYIPFFKKMFDDKMFEGFSYYAVRSGTEYNEEIKKVFTKNIKKVNNFKTWYSNNYDELLGCMQDGAVYCHFEESNRIAEGRYENQQTKGEWRFYAKNGALNRVGTFDDKGQKIGVWTSYYPNGQIKDIFNYTANKVNGELKRYSIKGVLLDEGLLKDDYYNGLRTKYYQTGGVSEKSEYQNGSQDGIVELYYRNGLLRAKAMLKKNEIDGPLEFFWLNGKLSSSKNYVNGVVQGDYKSYYSSGQLREEGSYAKGMFNGKYKNYYPDGTLKFEGTYKNGNYIGETKSYHQNGVLRTEQSFDESGKENGVEKEYYLNGKLLSNIEFKKGDIVKYVFYDTTGKILSQGTKSGKTLNYERYDNKGFLHSKGQFVNGLKQGDWTAYFALLQKPFSITAYKDGMQHGSYTKYYQNGQTSTKATYKEDELDGAYFVFSKADSTIVTYEGYYRNGSREGEFISRNTHNHITAKNYYLFDDIKGWQTYYSEAGKIVREEFIEDGAVQGFVYYDTLGKIMHESWLNQGTGEAKSYYPNGALCFSGNYKNGFADGNFTWYYPNGKVSDKGFYVNGNRHAKWESYYENGKLKFVRNYEYGSIHNEYLEYFENGQLSKKFHYVYDELDGEYLRYYENGKLRYKSQYHDGYEQGWAESYAVSGDLAIKRYYFENILIKYTYLDKNKNWVAEIPVEKGRQKIVAYFSNGNKSVEYEIENNDYQNDFIWYHTNGNIAKKSYYVNGLLENDYLEYTQAGKISLKRPYRFDEIHGLEVVYHDNGAIKSKTNYFNGDREGIMELYNNGGKLISSRFYFNDNFYSGDF